MLWYFSNVKASATVNFIFVSLHILVSSKFHFQILLLEMCWAKVPARPFTELDTSVLMKIMP